MSIRRRKSSYLIDETRGIPSPSHSSLVEHRFSDSMNGQRTQLYSVLDVVFGTREVRCQGTNVYTNDLRLLSSIFFGLYERSGRGGSCRSSKATR